MNKMKMNNKMEKVNVMNKEIKKTKYNVMFQKKYYQSYITFFILFCLLSLYLFIGAIATHWLDKPYIIISNYVFIGINCLVLCLVNYEILKLNYINKLPIYTQMITYILIVFLYLFPVEGVSLAQGGYMAINFEFYILLKWNWLKSWLMFVMYMVVLLMYVSLMLTSNKINFMKLIITFFFSIYMIFAFKSMTKFMLNNFYGWSSVLWLCLIMIVTDMFSFVGGISYGKHKLAPKISPNKTWEGTIIGMMFATGMAILYSILMFKFVNQSMTNHQTTMWVFDFFSNDNSKNMIRYIVYVILAIMLSCISQLGDLLFSLMKSYYNIKDFSNLLPGHGGMLDRLDSFSLVFIVMYVISNCILV